MSTKFTLINTTLSTVFPFPLFTAHLQQFPLSVDSDSKIDFARIFVRIDPISGGGLTSKDAEVFINKIKLGEFQWRTFNQDAVWILDIEIPVAALKVNSDLNELIIEVEQGLDVLGGQTQWSVFADIFYITVNKETGEETDPPDDPFLPPPEEEHEEQFNFFGLDLGQTITLLVGGTVAVVGLLAVSNISSRVLSKKN